MIWANRVATYRAGLAPGPCHIEIITLIQTGGSDLDGRWFSG